MKRSTVLLIVLVLVLGAVTLYLTTRDQTNTIKRELRDFAVQDTAAVDKIFMVRKSNDQVLLNREGDHWLVNEKYVVRTDAIDLLLKTLNRIKVKAPVPESAMDNVLTMMATRNTKVEIYSRGKLQKTIYVGGPTQDQMGTFMMLEGSSVPFVVHIPGFVGYLSTRFFTEENNWRSPIIFRYNFDEIAQIKSINNDHPEQSFVLDKTGTHFDMRTLSGNQQAPQLDTLAVKFFVSNFERVASEFFADGLPTEMLDSLNAANPFHILEVTNTLGTTTRVEAHRRPPLEETDEDGVLLEWDRERMYARVNGSDWVVIQYYVFDPLFREFEFFLPQQ